MERKIGFFTVVLLIALVGSALRPMAQESAEPSRTRGILDVLVVDENGKRMRGVTVAVPGYRSTTGLAGNCRFSLIPGRYSVLIKKQGYRGRRVYAGVKPDETTTLRIQLEKLPARSTPKD